MLIKTTPLLLMALAIKKISSTITQLRARVEDTSSDYDREKIQNLRQL